MSVAEYVLDTDLLHLCLADVIGEGFEGNSDECHCAAGTDQVEHLRHGRCVARALEDQIGSPAITLALDNLGSWISLTMTREQPAARAASTVTMPIGPAPMTMARSPGCTLALVAACTP